MTKLSVRKSGIMLRIDSDYDSRIELFRFRYLNMSDVHLFASFLTSFGRCVLELVHEKAVGAEGCGNIIFSFNYQLIKLSQLYHLTARGFGVLGLL